MNLKHSFPTQMRFNFCITRFGGRGHRGISQKYTKHPFLLLDRSIHSVGESVDETARTCHESQVDYSFWRRDVPRVSSSAKQNFIDMMRGKAADLYREEYRKNKNRLLMSVAEEYLLCVKRDIAWMGYNTSANKGLMDDLLETKWQVSTAFLEEKWKADEERMKSFPHINDVEEMCIASDHQVGKERRGKLIQLVCAWFRVISIAGHIPRLQPHFRGISFEKPEKKEVAPENPHPSDPEWLQIANQILDSGRVSDWYQTKASAYVKRRYPLRLFLVINKMLYPSLKHDSLPPLLAEWAELLQPKKDDWIALLYRLENSWGLNYSKVAEHMLDQESFQEANMRDCLDIICLYYKYDNSDFESILNKMKDKGMLPDIMFFALKAHMHSKAGNLDHAKEALDRAKDAFESLRSQVFQSDNKNC